MNTDATELKSILDAMTDALEWMDEQHEQLKDQARALRTQAEEIDQQANALMISRANKQATLVALAGIVSDAEWEEQNVPKVGAEWLEIPYGISAAAIGQPAGQFSL